MLLEKKLNDLKWLSATRPLSREEAYWLIEQAEKLNAIANAWVRIETSETESTSEFYNEVQDILSEPY